MSLSKRSFLGRVVKGEETWFRNYSVAFLKLGPDDWGVRGIHLEGSSYLPGFYFSRFEFPLFDFPGPLNLSYSERIGNFELDDGSVLERAKGLMREAERSQEDTLLRYERLYDEDGGSGLEVRAHARFLRGDYEGAISDLVGTQAWEVEYEWEQVQVERAHRSLQLIQDDPVAFRTQLESWREENIKTHRFHC